MNMTLDINKAGLIGDTKPVEDIEKLISAVNSSLPTLSIKRGEIIKFTDNKTQNCVILHQGSLAIHRRGDGMIIDTEQSPFIFGLNNPVNVCDTMYLRALEASEVSFIPSEALHAKVSEDNLWQSFVQVVLHTTSKVFEHCSQVQQMSAYDIVRYQLTELSHESDYVRTNTTVAKYIKNRTFLSRSGIMRILSELRTGNYINIENGILKAINYLPKKY